MSALLKADVPISGDIPTKSKLLTMVLMTGFVSLAAAAAQASAVETTSLGELSEVHQALLSAALGARDDRYRAQGEGDGFLLASPAQGLTASVAGDGIEMRGSKEAVRMHLLGWGCEPAFRPAVGGRAAAEANRVEIRREGLTEWYFAGPLGVEQGFTIATPAAGCEAADELVIELAI